MNGFGGRWVPAAVCSLLRAALWMSAMVPAISHAAFTTILNVPPDVVGPVIGSDTQLNVFDGGILAVYPGVDIGNPDGSSVNVEVNVYGGEIANVVRANSGSTINVLGGTASDSSIFEAHAGSRIDVAGGALYEIYAAGSSELNIAGGAIDWLTLDSGSVGRISGGTSGRVASYAGSDLTIAGGEYRLDGALVEGLGTVGSTVAVSLPAGKVLSGTLADGTPFNLSTQAGDEIAETVTLEAAALPAIGPSTIDVPTDPAPAGIRSGQTLIVGDGGVVPDGFRAGFGSTVVVTGGTIGQWEAVGAEVAISGGALDDFYTFFGTHVSMTGGWVDDFHAYGGSVIEVSGGTVDDKIDLSSGGLAVVRGGVFDGIDVHAGGVANVFGGVMDELDVFYGGVLNVFGGTTDDVDARMDGTVNLFGTRFVLAGTDITASLLEGVPFTITDRDVTLSGLLRDGSAFAFDLYADNGAGPCYFDPGATLTVTLVPPVPEPASVVLILLSGIMAAPFRRP